MNETLKRVFGEGFRVFFLSAGIFAVLGLAWWEVYLGTESAGGMITALPFTLAPNEWHGHELVFGYGSAALAGFLLTAVPNWTGTAAARWTYISLAAGIWLAGRLAIFWSAALPFWLAAAADLAFLPLLWVRIAALLIHRPKPANSMFLIFLSLFWIANLATWLGWAGTWADGASSGPRAGLLALAGMILVIAGRVGPGFTRNAMHRAGVATERLPRDWPSLAPTMLAAAVLLPVSALVWPGSAVAALLAIAAGAAQLLRQSRWGIGFAARQPILATLHLAAALTGLGLIALGLSRFGPLSEIAALHLLAIGGIAGMTLAMMSRATLGHAGRRLVAPPALVLAYALLPLAALLRWIASEAMGAAYYPAVLAAGALWILAFVLYVVALLPAFLGPRES